MYTVDKASLSGYNPLLIMSMVDNDMVRITNNSFYNIIII